MSGKKAHEMNNVDTIYNYDIVNADSEFFLTAHWKKYARESTPIALVFF